MISTRYLQIELEFRINSKIATDADDESEGTYTVSGGTAGFLSASIVFINLETSPGAHFL